MSQSFFAIIATKFSLSDPHIEAMNAPWFKKMQRMAGVTAEDLAREIGRDRSVVSKIYSGQRSMTLEFAQGFARVLNVPLSEVLTQAGMASPDTAATLDPDAKARDATPFTADARTRNVEAMADALGREDGMEIMQIRSNAMSLEGYLSGDYCLVDKRQADRVGPGDVVLAQIHTRTETETVLRRMEPPVLVAASTDPQDRRVHVVDGVNVVILGRVTASWRCPT